MRINDIRTTLLPGPSTNDPFLREARKLRSAIHWSARNQTDHARRGLLMVFRGAHTVLDPNLKEAYDAVRVVAASR